MKGRKGTEASPLTGGGGENEGVEAPVHHREEQLVAEKKRKT